LHSKLLIVQVECTNDLRKECKSGHIKTSHGSLRVPETQKWYRDVAYIEARDLIFSVVVFSKVDRSLRCRSCWQEQRKIRLLMISTGARL
jgi:hypothetical protein